MEAAMKSKLRFFWNGIKGTDGKLQRCWFGVGILITYPAGTVGIYKRDYKPFSSEVKAIFSVRNDSDGMTDYFEKDRIYVTPDHPLYHVALDAAKKSEEHYEKRFAPRAA